MFRSILSLAFVLALSAGVEAGPLRPRAAVCQCGPSCQCATTAKAELAALKKRDQDIGRTLLFGESRTAAKTEPMWSVRPAPLRVALFHRHSVRGWSW